jgi:hypothetical protein
MIDGTDTAGNQTQRFTVENGAVDKILITFDAHSHGTVVRRQIGSHQHGGNSARGLETESAQQSQQGGRTSPAGAASAIAKPGFEKGWSITTRQRPSWCFSQSDELAHIIKRHPPTPSRVDGV